MNGLRVCTANNTKVTLDKFNLSARTPCWTSKRIITKQSPKTLKSYKLITVSHVPCQNPLFMYFLSMAQLNSEGIFFIHSHLHFRIEKLGLWPCLKLLEDFELGFRPWGRALSSSGFGNGGARTEQGWIQIPGYREYGMVHYTNLGRYGSCELSEFVIPMLIWVFGAFKCCLWLWRLF